MVSSFVEAGSSYQFSRLEKLGFAALSHMGKIGLKVWAGLAWRVGGTGQYEGGACGPTVAGSELGALPLALEVWRVVVSKY